MLTQLGQQRPSAIPHSQNNDSFPCLVLLCIPYLGAWRRDSRYSGKYSILCCFFYYLFVSLFFVSPPSCEGRRETLQVSDWPILATLPLFRYFFFLQQQNLMELYHEQVIDKKRDPRGVDSCERRPFLPLTVQTFWDSVVWFHPGGTRPGRPRPALRTNRSAFCSRRFFSFTLLCFFLDVTQLQVETWQGDLFFWSVLVFYFSHRKKSETQTGDGGGGGGRVNLPLSAFYTAFQKHPPHTQEMYLYMMKMKNSIQ